MEFTASRREASFHSDRKSGCYHYQVTLRIVTNPNSWKWRTQMTPLQQEIGNIDCSDYGRRFGNCWVSSSDPDFGRDDTQLLRQSLCIVQRAFYFRRLLLVSSKVCSRNGSWELPQAWPRKSASSSGSGCNKLMSTSISYSSLLVTCQAPTMNPATLKQALIQWPRKIRQM